MYNHVLADYVCPICLGIEGVENEHTLLQRNDLVYRDELVAVFMNSFSIDKNPGRVIVVPNAHFENMYDLPPVYGARIFEISQKMALAFKEVYHCDGVTILQNNEPAGNQHAFHYHLHIFPRYTDDRLYEHISQKQIALPEERQAYAKQLKEWLEKNP